MITARQLALDALDRIERDGAYANLLLPELLQRSKLEARDRHFATELVYGTTRMKRACDFLVDRFVARELDLRVRNALRLGAYQLHYLQMAPHAAVGETVGIAPKAARGLVNAVLRRVAEAEVEWPDDATRLSYPDWILDRLATDLGADRARAALETMNEPPPVTERADGYVQDLASQWVAEAVDAHPGDRVADLCAAPGGKAMALAATGAHVAAGDIRRSRVGLIRSNAPGLPVLAADAARPPFRPGSFDRVLIDAPCSGLGTLRRRPDARWRIDEGSVPRLAAVQRTLVDAAVPLLRPGGTLTFSVCTLTSAETEEIDGHLATHHPRLEPMEPPGEPWEDLGRGARVLPARRHGRHVPAPGGGAGVTSGFRGQRLGKTYLGPKEGPTMSLFHRTQHDEDRAGDTMTRERPAEVHEPDVREVSTTGTYEPVKTRERTWTFAPGQVISLIVGIGAIALGLTAMVRAGIDGNFAEPVVEVLGFTHTAWLGLAEVGVGVLLVVAGTGAWGRPLSVLTGAAMVIGGVLIVAEPSAMPDRFAVEEGFGWMLVVFGAIVALASMALPVWRSRRVWRDGEPVDPDRSTLITH